MSKSQRNVKGIAYKNEEKSCKTEKIVEEKYEYCNEWERKGGKKSEQSKDIMILYRI